jgi:four helix bundle protein
MRFERFEDIFAWQKAKTLTISVYKAFENSRDFGFKDQIQRASVSIMINIAEGFDRQTNKEFAQFLYIAKESCSEVRSMLYLSEEISELSKNEIDQMVSQTVEISKILTGLIKSIKLN